MLGYQVYGQFPSFLLKVTPEQFAKTRFQINDRYLTARDVRYRQLTLHERTTDTGYLVTMPSPREDFQLCHININVPGDEPAGDKPEGDKPTKTDKPADKPNKPTSRRNSNKPADKPTEKQGEQTEDAPADAAAKVAAALEGDGGAGGVNV